MREVIVVASLMMLLPDGAYAGTIFDDFGEENGLRVMYNGEPHRWDPSKKAMMHIQAGLRLASCFPLLETQSCKDIFPCFPKSHISRNRRKQR